MAESSSVSIGDRVYRIEEDGKIKYVNGQVAVDGKRHIIWAAAELNLLSA